MKKLILTVLFTAAIIPTTNASIIMQGDYVKTAISDNGTLGWGGISSPGLLHDAAGTGTFNSDDYLTPGAPWETFTIKSDQTGTLTNNNDGPSQMIGTLTDISGISPYTNAVNWTSTFNSLFTISSDTFFNTDSERVSFTTTITALSDLTGLQFLRAIDPDQDYVSGGSHDTNNGRGFADLAAEDWVHSVGTITGLTLGLYSDSDVTHNTGVSQNWTIDPAFYLAGGNDGNGDYSIGMAFDIGTLLAGQSSTFDYHYVMGDELGSVDIPPAGVSAPSTFAIFSLGLIGFGLRRNKRK